MPFAFCRAIGVCYQEATRAALEHGTHGSKQLTSKQASALLKAAARECFDALQNWSDEHSYVKVILAGRSSGGATISQLATANKTDPGPGHHRHLPRFKALENGESASPSSLPQLTVPLAVLMTTHEARRLATQNTASGNDLRCKAIHDT